MDSTHSNLRESAPEWIWLTPPPSHYRQIIKLNDNEFIAIIANKYWTYNNKQNHWTQTQWNEPIYINNCCIEYENQLLWILNNYSIIKLNLNNNTMIETPTKEIDPGIGATFLIIDSCLHIIGGSDSTKHYKLQCNQLTPQCVFDFRANNYWKNGNYYHGLVHITSRNKLLLFGGYELGPKERTNEIFIHCLLNNTWKKLDCKLPKKLNSFGYVLTSDEKEVIIFGGNSGYSMSSDIFIVCLENMSIRQSKISCPNEGIYDAILLSECNINEIFIYGYFRYCCHCVYELPADIVHILLGWISTDYIHLLSHREHWKLPLSDVVTQK